MLIMSFPSCTWFLNFLNFVFLFFILLQLPAFTCYISYLFTFLPFLFNYSPLLSFLSFFTYLSVTKGNNKNSHSINIIFFPFILFQTQILTKNENKIEILHLWEYINFISVLIKIIIEITMIKNTKFTTFSNICMYNLFISLRATWNLQKIVMESYK